MCRRRFVRDPIAVMLVRAVFDAGDPAGASEIFADISSRFDKLLLGEGDSRWRRRRW
jgi:hypothetical protein